MMRSIYNPSQIRLSVVRVAAASFCFVSVALPWAWAEDKPATVQTSFRSGAPVDLEQTRKPASLTEKPAPSFSPAVPPLSVGDALESLYRIFRSLPDAKHIQDTRSTQQLDRGLQSVLQYVRNVDSAYPTLPYYQWHSVGRTRVKRDGIERDTVKPSTPVPNVSAIGFTVRRGDVWFSKIRVFGTDGTRFEFNIDKKILSALPRREICMLATEIELERIEISYRQVSREGSKKPRVTVEAGISSLPEHGKKSIYNLLLTRQAIDGERYPEARAYLSEAIRSLTAYKKSRNL